MEGYGVDLLAILRNIGAKVLLSTKDTRCRVCGNVLSAINADGVCQAESCRDEDEVLKAHNSGL